MARKRRARAASGGSAYTLTPEQRAAAEKEEAERLAAVQAKKDAERRRGEVPEAEKHKMLEGSRRGVVMTWVYEKDRSTASPEVSLQAREATGDRTCSHPADDRRPRHRKGWRDDSIHRGAVRRVPAGGEGRSAWRRSSSSETIARRRACE